MSILRDFTIYSILRFTLSKMEKS